MLDSKKIIEIKKWLGSGSINLFGRPFAGKDAQALLLNRIIDGNIIGGGDILRHKSMPDKIKQLMKTGKLIPTEDYVDIVLPYLNQKHLANKPLILSSVGRWHGEELGVINAVEKANHELKAVIYLDISNDESYARWLKREINNDRSNRHDDTKEILEVRFQEFQEKTIPVIEYYEKSGLLIKIDGNQTRQEVTQDILKALFLMAKNNNNHAC